MLPLRSEFDSTQSRGWLVGRDWKQREPPPAVMYPASNPPCLTFCHCSSSKLTAEGRSTSLFFSIQSRGSGVGRDWKPREPPPTVMCRASNPPCVTFCHCPSCKLTAEKRDTNPHTSSAAVMKNRSTPKGEISCPLRRPARSKDS